LADEKRNAKRISRGLQKLSNGILHTAYMYVLYILYVACMYIKWHNAWQLSYRVKLFVIQFQCQGCCRFIFNAFIAFQLAAVASLSKLAASAEFA